MEEAYNLFAETKYGDFNIDKESAEVKKYIQEGDRLQIEAASTSSSGDPVLITIKGYEMDLEFD